MDDQPIPTPMHGTEQHGGLTRRALPMRSFSSYLAPPPLHCPKPSPPDVRATGVEDSRRFLRELDEAPGGNNLHYILQCLHVPALVTRVWTRKGCRVATECSWNDGSKTQYYVVILDQLPGRSRRLERTPEWHVRGPLTTPYLRIRPQT